MAKVKTITGTTSSGFTFEIDEEARDDMELLEELVAMSEGRMDKMPGVLTSLLGEEQKAALYEHCRGKSGRVSSKRVADELTDIFHNAKSTESDTKN